MPMNSVIETMPSHRSTLRALSASGDLKAATPSETASMPVSAVHPEANARMRRRMLTDSTGSGYLSYWMTGTLELTTDATPYAIKPSMLATNRYVGAANSFPDSRMPLRFPRAMMPMAAMPSTTRYGYSAGTAEVIAATPAATLTATVKM